MELATSFLPRLLGLTGAIRRFGQGHSGVIAQPCASALNALDVRVPWSRVEAAKMAQAIPGGKGYEHPTIRDAAMLKRLMDFINFMFLVLHWQNDASVPLLPLSPGNPERIH